MDLTRRKIQLGWWENEPIWRYETTEELMERLGVAVADAKLYMILNEKNANNEK